MDNTIAWPMLLVGVVAALSAAAALVYLRSQGSHRSSRDGGGLMPVAYLVLVILMLTGGLLTVWALNLRGTLGR